MREKRIYKVVIFTGTRAEYGILRPLIKALCYDQDFNISLLVTGTHLCREFGYTVDEIYKDKWQFDLHLVESILAGDTPVSVSKSMGLGLISYAEKLTEIAPDILIILGDRFEAMAAATAAVTCNIKIAHIQGGEITKGAVDDLYRHAITKMSSLHFVATEVYKNRVLQMGESPNTVFNVGALNVEAMTNQKIASKSEFYSQFKILTERKISLVTLHPSTLEPKKASDHVDCVLEVIRKRPDIFFIITKTIADSEGRIINDKMEEGTKGLLNVYLTSSLGHFWYKTALKYCDLCIGNSSSGIIETPQFKIPTLNIGNRETGRVQAKNVVNCKFDVSIIMKNIDYLLSDEFQLSLENFTDPYFKEGTSHLIVSHLKEMLSNLELGKTFNDLL